MKSPIFIFSLIIFLAANSFTSSAQNSDTTLSRKSVISIIVKNDGTEFVGKIISQDAREVLIETKKMGQIIIPKHEIREIREANANEITSKGDYLPGEVFSTRYFITTNGLPIQKGESYIQWNLYGPDFQFGIGKNFGIGIMTSWLAMPIIGSAKYSLELGQNVNLGLGLLLGTGSWVKPDFGIALPFSALTFGDRKRNITISAGYGSVFYKEETYNYISNTYSSRQVNDGRMLLSFAGLFKITEKLSLIFDSFIVPPGGYHDIYESRYDYSTNSTYMVTVRKRRADFMFLMPGIRWHMENNKAFQFGFAGLRFDGEFVPLPIPMVQWYRKL